MATAIQVRAYRVGECHVYLGRDLKLCPTLVAPRSIFDCMATWVLCNSLFLLCTVTVQPLLSPYVDRGAFLLMVGNKKRRLVVPSDVRQTLQWYPGSTATGC